MFQNSLLSLKKFTSRSYWFNLWDNMSSKSELSNILDGKWEEGKLALL
jgi:hypothetical protein